MVRLDTLHHLIVHGPPPLDLFLVIPIPILFRRLQKVLVSFGIPNFFQRTNLIYPSTLGRHIKWFRQGEVDDTHLVLNGVPVLSALAFDREVAVVNMRKPNDLLAVVEVEETLFCFVVFVVVPVDLGQHVIENPGIGLDGQNAGVEPD